MQTEDAKIIERVRAGDHEAFRALVDTHSARVMAYLASRLADPQLVQDLVQETFITAFQSLDGYQERALFSTWVTGIARNKMLTHLRDAKRHQNREEALRSELMLRMAPDVDQIHAADTEASLGRLRGCLERLSPNVVQVVRARYLENESVRDIGDRLGRTPDAVRATLTRARRSLRVCVAGGA